jgi:hypothetical protein
VQTPCGNTSTDRFWQNGIEVLESQHSSLEKIDGQAFADQIHADITPYLKAGSLHPFFGTRLAQIIIAGFEPDTKTSMILALGVDLDRNGAFSLQPLPVADHTTVRGTTFQLKSDRAILPFGEVEYFRQNVISGVGTSFLGDTYREFLQKKNISDIDAQLGTSVAANLIEAASKATELIAAPSGIGGGVSVALIADEVQFLK